MTKSKKCAIIKVQNKKKVVKTMKKEIKKNLKNAFEILVDFVDYIDSNDCKNSIIILEDGTKIEYCDLLEGLENFIKNF